MAQVQRKGMWRRAWVLVAAPCLGLMYALLGGLIIPSSGLWTGRFLCSDGFHLASQHLSARGFTGASTYQSYQCVKGSATRGVSTLAEVGLQLVLGVVVAYVLCVVAGLLVVRWRNAPAASKASSS